jgi:hypothetical protein
MHEITCEISPRISRGLGHSKVRSSTMSKVRLGHHTCLSSPLLCFVCVWKSSLDTRQLIHLHSFVIFNLQYWLKVLQSDNVRSTYYG